MFVGVLVTYHVEEISSNSVYFDNIPWFNDSGSRRCHPRQISFLRWNVAVKPAQPWIRPLKL